MRNEELPFNEDELQKSYPIPFSNPLKILSNPLEPLESLESLEPLGPLESSRILSNPLKSSPTPPKNAQH